MLPPVCALMQHDVATHLQIVTDTCSSQICAVSPGQQQQQSIFVRHGWGVLIHILPSYRKVAPVALLWALQMKPFLQSTMTACRAYPSRVPYAPSVLHVNMNRTDACVAIR